MGTIVVGVDCGASGDDVLGDALQALTTGMVSTIHVVHVLSPHEAYGVDETARHGSASVLALIPGALRARLTFLADMLGVTCPAESDPRGMTIAEQRTPRHDRLLWRVQIGNMCRHRLQLRLERQRQAR